FDDERVYEVLHKVVHDDPVAPSKLKPDLDRDLETVNLKAMEKEKERRYQSALDLKHDLDRWLGGDPVLARRAGTLYVWKKRAQKNKAIAITLGVAAVAFAGALSVNRVQDY